MTAKTLASLSIAASLSCACSADAFSSTDDAAAEGVADAPITVVDAAADVTPDSAHDASADAVVVVGGPCGDGIAPVDEVASPNADTV